MTEDLDGNPKSFPRWYTGPATINGEKRWVVEGNVTMRDKTLSVLTIVGVFITASLWAALMVWWPEPIFEFFAKLHR